jgi:hypothetical protein
MTADRSEMKIDQLRNLTSAERTERFQSWKARLQAPDATTSTRTTRWHLVDEDMTPEQHGNIPAARHGDTRTPVLWVKFRHRWLKEVMVARGYFDYDGGTWTVRLSSIEEGDSIGEVVAIAWAPIVAGQRPWDGPMIPKRVADPW